MRIVWPVVVIGGLVLLPSAVSAQAFRMACNTQSLCAGVQPGGGRLIDCLRDHKAELSNHCKVAIADFVLNSKNRNRTADTGAGPQRQSASREGPGPQGPGPQGSAPQGNGDDQQPPQ